MRPNVVVLALTEINLAIIVKSIIAMDILNKKEACHPKHSTIPPPTIKPIIAPPVCYKV
jgi:hypothetical protein